MNEELKRGAGHNTLHMTLNDEEREIINALCEYRGEPKRSTMIKSILREEWERVQNGELKDMVMNVMKETMEAKE